MLNTEYKKDDFLHDFLASLVVFLVALPLCLGIALASGVPPIVGLMAGIIGGLVVGSFTGSPLQVSGPALCLADNTEGDRAPLHSMCKTQCKEAQYCSNVVILLDLLL